MNIKELRKKSGLSQQEMADKTGIPKDRIAKWEQGKGAPKAKDHSILEKLFKEDVPPATPATKAYKHKENGSILNEPDPNGELRPSKYEAASGQQTALEAILNLSESNKKLAEANLAMMRMLEKKGKDDLSKKTSG